MLALAAAMFAQDASEARVAVLGTEVRYWHGEKSGEKPAPLVVILPGGGGAPAVRQLFDQWRQLTAARGWQAIVP